MKGYTSVVVGVSMILILYCTVVGSSGINAILWLRNTGKKIENTRYVILIGMWQTGNFFSVGMWLPVTA